MEQNRLNRSFERSCVKSCCVKVNTQLAAEKCAAYVQELCPTVVEQAELSYLNVSVIL